MITILLLAGIATATLASYMAFSSQAAQMTRRTVDYQSALVAAESGLEYGVMKLRDVILAHQFTLSHSQLQAMLDSIPPPPPIGDYAFETLNGEKAFRISVTTPVITGTITNGAACLGGDGEYQLYTITVGAFNRKTGISAVLEQKLQGIGLFLIRYAVFYEDDLEINPGAAMEITGKIHVNANLYLAPNNTTLRCTDRITAVGDIYRRRKDSNQNTGTVYVNDSNGIEKNMNISSESPDWMIKAIERWQGRVLSKAHGVQHLSPPIAPVDSPYALIGRPGDPADPNYQIQTEGEKFSNKACLFIHIDSTGGIRAVDCRNVDLTDEMVKGSPVNSGSFGGRPTFTKTGHGTYPVTANGSYDYQQRFYDHREKAVMAPVDIYVDNLIQKLPQIANSYYSVPEGRGVVFVTRDSPAGSPGVIPCVRLRNGRSLPAGGLSFASDLPLYVEGDYNTEDTRPSLVTGDAVTFLSKAWQDAFSWTTTLNDRTGVNTTYNVVVMTGNTPTSWGNYNGGLENGLRFLENWSGRTVTHRGSVIVLWHSRIATGAWFYGSPVYTAPNRDWGYDPMYLTAVPPGMTRVFGLEEITWRQTTAAAAGWN